MSKLKVAALQGLSASSDAITLANDGTCTANITNNLSNRNLIINGAMQVAQRGTSSTSQGYQTVDRFSTSNSGLDEAPTREQVDITAGTTPYTLGFRKAFKITNGNQTSGAGTSDDILIQHKLEGQDVAGSGWNYLSSSSNITLSFWVKSSVAQNFYFALISQSGTQKNYPMETGSLSADTWTKITKTIPGNSGITINNDNALGLYFEFMLFRGTDKTGSVNLNEWSTYSGSARTPDQTSTWYTTNDATFELSGVQLEVSDYATDFEHRSYGDELARCQRYYQRIVNGTTQTIGLGFNFTTTEIDVVVDFPTAMRAAPSLEQVTGGDYFAVLGGGDSNTFIDGTWSIFGATTSRACIYATADASTAGKAKFVRTYNASAFLAFKSEI